MIPSGDKWFFNEENINKAYKLLEADEFSNDSDISIHSQTSLKIMQIFSGEDLSENELSLEKLDEFIKALYIAVGKKEDEDLNRKLNEIHNYMVEFFLPQYKSKQDDDIDDDSDYDSDNNSAISGSDISNKLSKLNNKYSQQSISQKESSQGNAIFTLSDDQGELGYNDPIWINLTGSNPKILQPKSKRDIYIENGVLTTKSTTKSNKNKPFKVINNRANNINTPSFEFNSKTEFEGNYSQENGNIGKIISSIATIAKGLNKEIKITTYGSDLRIITAIILAAKKNNLKFDHDYSYSSIDIKNENNPIKTQIEDLIDYVNSLDEKNIDEKIKEFEDANKKGLLVDRNIVSYHYNNKFLENIQNQEINENENENKNENESENFKVQPPK